MKHSTSTQSGTFRRSRPALLMLGMLAAVLIAAAPAPAQDQFFGATKINVVNQSIDEFNSNLRSNHDALPAWAKIVLSEPYVRVNAIDSPEGDCGLLNQFLYQTKRDPVFTPDGNSIMFGDHMFGAWIVPVEGGEPRLACNWIWKLLYNNSGNTSGGFAGIWQTCGLSPDGTEVVGVQRLFTEGLAPYDSLLDTHGRYYQILRTNASTIVSRNIETKVETILAKDAIEGRFSHDGNWFAFVKRDPLAEIYTVGAENYFSWERMITGLYVKDMSTGAEQQIAAIAICPRFSPDDASVICSMKDVNGIWQVFSIPREGGIPQQLTFYGPNDTGRNARVSDVSPGGDWILHTGDYSVNGMTKTGLCACNIVTGISYPFFPEADCVTTDGSFSPDGTKIVFSVSSPSDNPYSSSDMYSLYIMDFNPDALVKSTAVAEALPVGFAISGNYPNPFNPSTTIDFSLPASGQASLAVFSVTGQKIRELVSGSLPAGRHSVVWDGRDQNGSAVSSGVYISRLMMNDKTTTNRMLLVK
jgi:hypothetical protein